LSIEARNHSASFEAAVLIALPSSNVTLIATITAQMQLFWSLAQFTN
jgi:hypothetical protein